MVAAVLKCALVHRGRTLRKSSGNGWRHLDCDLDAAGTARRAGGDGAPAPAPAAAAAAAVAAAMPPSFKSNVVVVVAAAAAAVVDVEALPAGAPLLCGLEGVSHGFGRSSCV